VPPDRPPARHDKPATARVFFALWPPPALAGELAGIAANAAREFGGKPTRPETIHLTLAFLGDVTEQALPGLVALADAMTAGRFDLAVDHLGYWPHKHLLWAGCQASPVLAELAGDLHRRLVEAGFDQHRQAGHLVPHLTLVRKLAAEPAIKAISFPQVMPWPCHEFVLVRSRLSPAGPDYEILARFPLGN